VFLASRTDPHLKRKKDTEINYQTGRARECNAASLRQQEGYKGEARYCRKAARETSGTDRQISISLRLTRDKGKELEREKWRSTGPQGAGDSAVTDVSYHSSPRLTSPPVARRRRRTRYEQSADITAILRHLRRHIQFLGGLKAISVALSTYILNSL